MSFKTSASCPRKAQARLDTIVNIYRELFYESLPIDKQYWTLAGPCYDENGNIGKKSEIHQLTSSGLFSTSQYHGIDNSVEIIEKNKIVAPTGNFYHGDFINQLQVSAQLGIFNPGIINCDFTRMIKTSAVDVGNVMYILNSHDIHDTMVVINFPANNSYGSKEETTDDIDEVIDGFWNRLSTNQRFNYSWKDDCFVYPECYLYGGTGEHSKTTMVTFVIYKK